MARHALRQHRRRAPGDGGGASDGVYRIRSHRSQPARRIAADHSRAVAAAALRPHGDCRRRRRHRDDWRPERQVAGAGAAVARADRRQRRRYSRAAGALPGFRRCAQSRPHGQQCGLARRDRRPVVSAGRGQAFHRQQHAAEGVGEPPVGDRRGDLLHRVQLPRAPGVRLPAAVRPLRVQLADGRERSVGEHHRRHRSHPESPGGQGARAGVAAAADGDRREIRQDRGGRGVARRGAHVAIPLLSVLVEHGRPRGGAVSPVLHVRIA